MRILLVEDDKLLGDGIVQGLKQAGHNVDWMQDGQAGQSALESEVFDVCILDLGLPRKGGLEVLAAVRAKEIDIKVLILTALSRPEEKVAGLDAGADDYLTKPFDMEELLARVRALQRRSTGRTVNKIIYKNIEIDPNARTVTLDGEELVIPKKEYTLLAKLLENAGNVITKDHLEQSLYSWGSEVDSNALEVHIHNLRKKFGSDLIRTVRGVGYIIDTSDKSDK